MEETTLVESTSPRIEEDTDDSEEMNNFDPKSLPQPLAILTSDVFDDTDEPTGNQCTFYILGTAHVSKASCDDTRRLISVVSPSVVMVELCPERQALLHLSSKSPTENSGHRSSSPNTISLVSALSSIRSGKSTPFQAIYSWLLARISHNLEIAPGEEFRVAVQEAHSLGAAVVLGDRPVNITFSRLWGALDWWEKCRLLGDLLWTGMSSLNAEEMQREIEHMKDKDVLTEAIKEMSKNYPSLLSPLLTERDQYMVCVLRCLADKAPNGKVVAVVGAGHLEGIQRHWNEEIDIDAICTVHGAGKRRWRVRRMVLMVSVVGVVGMFSWGKFRART